MKDNLTDLRHQLDSLQEDFHSLIPELAQAAREVEKPRLFPLLNRAILHLAYTYGGSILIEVCAIAPTQHSRLRRSEQICKELYLSHGTDSHRGNLSRDVQRWLYE
jgi:hypothetical protein